MVGTAMHDSGVSTEKTYPDYKVYGANMRPPPFQEGPMLAT